MAPLRVVSCRVVSRACVDSYPVVSCCVVLSLFTGQEDVVLVLGKMLIPTNKVS